MLIFYFFVDILLNYYLNYAKNKLKLSEERCISIYLDTKYSFCK